MLVYILSNILWHFVTPPKCFRDRFLVIIQSGSQSLFKSAIQLAQSLAVATSAEDKTKSVKSKRIDGLTEDKILKMDKLGFPQSNEGMTFVDFTTLICSMVSDIHTVSQDEMKRLFQLFDVVSIVFFCFICYFPYLGCHSVFVKKIASSKNIKRTKLFRTMTVNCLPVKVMH